VQTRRPRRWRAFQLQGLRVILALQLAVILCAVSRVPVSSFWRPVAEFLIAFGDYTGSGNRYTFYAPRPSLPFRVVARLYSPERGEWISETLDWKQPEAALRLATVTDRLQDETLAKEQAASWAGWFFGRHPDTTVALIEVQYWNLPPLNKVRNSPPALWTPLRVYSFARRDVPLFGRTGTENDKS
jgi:hypothetical protein